MFNEQWIAMKNSTFFSAPEPAGDLPDNGHTAGPHPELQGLSRRLAKDHALDPASLIHAEQQACEDGISLLEQVIKDGLLSTSQATLSAAWEYGLPIINPEILRLDALPPARDFSVALLRSLCVLPLRRRGNSLVVAVPSPSSLARLDELQFATGLVPEGVLAPVDQLISMLDAYLTDSEDTLSEQLGDMASSLEELCFENEEDSRVDLSNSLDELPSDDAPIVKFINKILLDAIRQGASDIHFEPYETTSRVRFRVDGILHDVAQPPFSMRLRIAARLKVMSHLDISERRLPQDGAIKLRVSKTRSIDFRVNSLPTVFGEKVVLRILDPASAQMGIESLGFTDAQRELYQTALMRPQGMILVTGPTGSGKTVTLYTGINILNNESRNICTAEDPVEIKVPGINQVHVLPRIGLDFANALRAFLRQDPDVVMVGEIRDLETADISIKAAQTGHLVLSTVHTNSAADTIARLSNMGVASFNTASSVSLIIAQRLARRLCNKCKQPTELPAQVLLDLGFTPEQANRGTAYEPVGCRHCTQGYKGRLGIYEVVPITNELSQLILADASALEVDQVARKQGYPDLRHSGLEKVMLGMTSLSEVNRVTTD